MRELHDAVKLDRIGLRRHVEHVFRLNPKALPEAQIGVVYEVVVDASDDRPIAANILDYTPESLPLTTDFDD